MKNIKVIDLLCDAGIFEKEYLDEKEVEKYSQDKIIKEGSYNYLIKDFNMSDEEIKLALLAKQTKHIKTIKNIVLFTFIVSIISAVLVLVALYM